jgi:hypothetical protein
MDGCRLAADKFLKSLKEFGCSGVQHPILAIGQTGNSQARRIAIIAKVGVKGPKSFALSKIY